MVKGTLLLETPTFLIPAEEKAEYAACMSEFMECVEKCRENGDVVYGKGDLLYSIFLGKQLFEYCDSDALLLLQAELPGFTRDMHFFLTYDLMKMDSNSLEDCKDLAAMEKIYPGNNNGLLGLRSLRFGCQAPFAVFSEETWQVWKVDYLSRNPDKIDWTKSKHSYLPNLEYSNTLLGKECRGRFKGEGHIDFHSRANKLAGAAMVTVSREVGKIVAEANFYSYDAIVSKKNNNNGQIRDIYSLEIKGRSIFLSVDVDNAAFEVCSEDGKHLGEYPFDGSEPKAADKTGKHDIIVK